MDNTELIALETVDGGPAYYYLRPMDSDESGSLLFADDEGDTLLPPYPGRYTCLGATDSLADAEGWAVECEAQR